MVLTIKQMNEFDRKNNLEGFPKSEYFPVGYDLMKAYHFDLAIASFKRGAENDGCIACIYCYVDLQLKRNNVHLALPWALEGAIRGHVGCMERLLHLYCKMKTAVPHALTNFWMKMMIEFVDTNKSEEHRKGIKKEIGAFCFTCEKEEETETKDCTLENNDNLCKNVNSTYSITSTSFCTLQKCGICKYYLYCGKECQLYHWNEGNHIGECRQLKILRKYYKSCYAKEIHEAITIRGDSSKDISRLQTLRTKLGLNRPKKEYEELVLLLSNDDDDNNNDNRKSRSRNRSDYLVGKKDGTLHIGSTSNVI